MTAQHRILIIGGYGTFGARLVRLLMREPALTLLVAGRSMEKAHAFVRTLEGAATVVAVALDREGDLRSEFRALQPDLVVDASGPFQHYGDDRYRVVEATIETGAHYLDLADDRDFVLGVRRFDQAAKEAGRFVISGASTCPALTAAVYRRLTRDFSSVDKVTGGIAPSPYSGVGPNVIRAIASNAGQAIRVRRSGRDTVAWPSTETKRYSIGAAGDLPLRSLRFSLVDVPDLALLGELTPKPESVWFGAAPVPSVYHLLFRWLARGVKLGIFQSLTALAPAMNAVMNHFSWGEHRGGLFLECSGNDRQGQSRTRSWHLLAEGNAGPKTPTLASVALIRKLIENTPPKSGARPAHIDLELEDFEPLFAELGVKTGLRDHPPPSSWPLFRRMLGQSWAAVPRPVADAHSFSTKQVLKGQASIVRGRSLVARAVAALVGFPLSGDDVPVTVTITRRGDTEHWERNFSGRRFVSRLSAGRGAWSGLIRERFGLLSFGMALVVDNNRLRFVMRRWSVAGIPMPQSLKPNGQTCESVRNGRFRFDVEIAFPLIGHIVTYRGWLNAVRPSAVPAPLDGRA